MSTKKIREALEWLRSSEAALANEEKQSDYNEAKAELENIEAACLDFYLKGTEGISDEAAALLMDVGQEAWTPEAAEAIQ